MSEKETTTPTAGSTGELPSGLTQLAEAIRQAMSGAITAANPKRENPNYVEDSVYKPKGVFKVPQTRRYFWKNAEVEWNMITPDEADLFERLRPGDYHERQTVNPTGGPERTVFDWHVRPRMDGNTSELFIDFPVGDTDQRASLPSMKAMLLEMVEGVPAS